MTEPSMTPSPGVMRSIRVLSILERETDEDHYLTARTIAEEARHPSDPTIAAVDATIPTVRAAIRTLRALGYDISSDHQEGYALIGREFSRHELNLIMRVVAQSPLLDAQQRIGLLEHLLVLCTPSQREEHAMRLRRLAQKTSRIETTTITFIATSAETVVRAALAGKTSVSFELASSQAAPDGSRRRLIPSSLRNRDGIWFVGGADRPTPTQRGGRRTLRLDRLRNLTTRTPAGTVYVAVDTTSKAPLKTNPSPFSHQESSPQSADGNEG